MSTISKNSNGYSSSGAGCHEGAGANASSTNYGHCSTSLATDSGDITDSTPRTSATDYQSNSSDPQAISSSAIMEIIQALIAVLMQMFGQFGAPSKQGFTPAQMAAGGGGGGADYVAHASSSASTTSNAPATKGAPPNGFADDWHTVRFSNTTNEPLVVHLTMGAGDSLPPGVRETGRLNGEFTIQPGESTDITFAPGSKPNFRSTKGDGSVWNQGEITFDEARKGIYFNLSYIYGANSNMRMYSSDGKHSGFEGDVLAGAPGAARVGSWGIAAPYNRAVNSNDPNNPDSAAGGPNGPKNAGAAYLYSILQKGEGYVGRGMPVEKSDYDDASTLYTSGKLAVVF